MSKLENAYIPLILKARFVRLYGTRMSARFSVLMDTQTINSAFGRYTIKLIQYGEFSKIVELHGHTQRVLHLALAPDDSTVCSASADETLRFWKVFNNQKLSLHDDKKSPNRLNPTHCSLR